MRRRAFVLLSPALLAVTALACSGGIASGTTDIVAGVLPAFEAERLHYRIVADDGAIIGLGTLTATGDRDAGWALVQEYRASDRDPDAAAPFDDRSTVIVGARLLPLAATRRIEGVSRAQTYAVAYDAAESRITFSGDQTEPRQAALRDHSYDNESSLWLWRTLDFSDDYEARYISVNPVDRSQQVVSLRVVDRRTIEVPAGTFDVWRLLIRTGRASRTAWIEVAVPHRIIQWDNGETRMRLTAIESVNEP